MIIDKQVNFITYDIELKFNKTEKEILESALEILKVVNKELDKSYDDLSVSSLVIEKDVNDLILEMDRYTDYICKN